MTAHYSPTANTVRLDPRRLAQLKAVAEAIDTTSAGVISQWLRSCVENGVIPADIPGIVIGKVEGGITIAIDGAEPVALDRDMAGKVVTSLRAAIDTGAGTIEPFAAVPYGVVKKGPGIRLMLPFYGTGAQKLDNSPSFPVDLAEDLVGQIEKALA
ncbi:hypothetical protein [Bosea sp. MMO-172]|uniref:hypothetical protein n=1 Tax=Bosea sp. MMO-172 TaxID=3127885 RepID=UPI0030194AF3